MLRGLFCAKILAARNTLPTIYHSGFFKRFRPPRPTNPPPTPLPHIITDIFARYKDTSLEISIISGGGFLLCTGMIQRDSGVLGFRDVLSFERSSSSLSSSWLQGLPT